MRHRRALRRRRSWSAGRTASPAQVALQALLAAVQRRRELPLQALLAVRRVRSARAVRQDVRQDGLCREGGAAAAGGC